MFDCAIVLPSHLYEGVKGGYLLIVATPEHNLFDGLEHIIGVDFVGFLGHNLLNSLLVKLGKKPLSDFLTVYFLNCVFRVYLVRTRQA